MIEQIRIIRGISFDPYLNLAIEQQLMETNPRGCCALYLWQNANTVVIGRNQNAWKECRTGLLEEEGGRLARRLSGGGAVFHDLGNLNFTFLMDTEDADVRKQSEVVIRACAAFGIEAGFSGRNDILAEGRKFSGSAYYNHKGKSYHHGTLLVDVDMEKLGRYLKPSAAKLRSKGVDSVRSRVVNLKELSGDVTIEGLGEALIESFGEVYGLSPELITADSLDMRAVEALRARNASRDWLYGRDIPCDISCSARFPWGEIEAELGIGRGAVETVRVYSDSMDWTVSARIEEALRGCVFDPASLEARLAARGLPEREDIMSLFNEQIFK